MTIKAQMRRMPSVMPIVMATLRIVSSLMLKSHVVSSLRVVLVEVDVLDDVEDDVLLVEKVFDMLIGALAAVLFLECLLAQSSAAV